MITTVVNTHETSCDVYCGRPTIFGNPFILGQHGTREEVVFKHLVYFRKRLISDPNFKRAVLTLKGKKIGCCCHYWDGIGENPLYCHCDNIASYLNLLPS